MNKLPITVLIPTYNEEIHLQRCLESIRELAGEIVVVDSFSTDKTLEIARRLTSCCVQHPYKNHGSQMNWALKNLSFPYEWIMQLDADEIVTKELADELRATLPNISKDVSALYARRRVYFMGRWIKYGDYYPLWFLRIFRRGKVRYEEFEDGRVEVLKGKVRYLKHDFIDFNQKGLTFWIDKHNQCSTNEMSYIEKTKLEAAFFARQDQRRRWLKKCLYGKIPLFLRVFLYFVYRYIFRLGFLDGVEGLIFHFLQGFWYRFLVDSKIYEAEKSNKVQQNEFTLVHVLALRR